MIFNEDCISAMQRLIDLNVKADAVITSPPYDDLRNYDNTCSWNFDKFKEVANLLYQILDDGGVVIWVVADKTENGSETGTSFKQALYFKEIGFNLHDTMIYRKINYMPLNHNRYEQEFEYMFCFSKGKPKTFNPIKIPCKYAGQEHWGKMSYYKDDSDNLTEVERNKIADSKIHGNIFEYRIGSTNETSEFKHPAMFPLELAKDQVKTWTNEGDTVLDCFMGAGTTGVASLDLGRKFIGIELVEKYFDMSKERLKRSGIKKRLV